MAASALHIDPPAQVLTTQAIVDRATLTLFLGDLAQSVNADFYMLLTMATRERRLVGRVVAANWMFDAVELVDPATFGALANGGLAALPGTRPRPLTTGHMPCSDIDAVTSMLLNRLGHAELYILRLNVGRNSYCLVLSAAAVARIDGDRLAEAQMRCNYALSAMPDELRASVFRNMLTPRERECLAWAAEGKTSEEIALILDVHANVANSAIALAMEKLHARNRVEAVATAIRVGIL